MRINSYDYALPENRTQGLTLAKRLAILFFVVWARLCVAFWYTARFVKLLALPIKLFASEYVAGAV